MPNGNIIEAMNNRYDYSSNPSLGTNLNTKFNVDSMIADVAIESLKNNQTAVDVEQFTDWASVSKERNYITLQFDDYLKSKNSNSKII